MQKVTVSAEELFAFDSDKLVPNQPKLDEVVSVLNANPSVTDVTIIGYTDRIGAKAYNMKLSERRANAVKDYLVSKGIPGDKLHTEGRGPADPVVECTGVKPRSALIKCLAPNRRVELQPITGNAPSQ
jgi:OOP family OmpA-OmpF porin